METTTETVVEQPVTPVEPVEPPVLSISDHAAVYGPTPTEDPDAPEGETQAQKAERLHHSAEQRREKTGEFAPGRKRGASNKNDAALRIEQLNGKTKDAVARATNAESRLAAAESELARLRQQHAPVADIKQAEKRVERAESKVEIGAFAEPEPSEDDPKFEGDYGKYLRAAAAWEGRKAYHDAKAGEAQQAAENRKREEADGVVKTFGTRVDAAKAKYQDFEAVAFGPTRIMAGSPIDAFVMEDEHGPHVLYYLNQHPDEVDRLQAMSPVRQLTELALLSQRFLSPPLAQAGTTGSAAERKTIVLPPRPPNPVRTEAQRASDSPPPTDGSLSIAEHRKAFGPKVR